jgi:signal transduction histidine kinase/flagellar motor switch protein FliG
MEVVIIVLLPVLFLVLAASMLVVSQLSGFFQFGKYSRRRRHDRQELDKFMTQLALAQGQVYQRSRELEALSSRLQTNNEELARLNGMKSKFLSMAVHDVRTPLASIKGFGEMLTRQPLDATQRKYVDYIVRGTDQINKLMSDLTDLAVIEAGKLRMEKSPFPLSQMLKDIVPPIGVVAKKNNVEFIAVEPAQDVTIVGDRFRLVQALMNFLNNAVKFTPEGGKVELKVAASPRNIIFAVRDTGPGIHPSERAKIFEKFYQSQFSDPKNRKKGWGLGLCIAQEIVRAHFGEIGVDSAGLGKGSTFWYRIPLKPSPLMLKKAAAAAAILAMLAGFPALSRAQQSMPLAEKAQFEQALEQKVGGVLLQLVGPSRYKVVVDATLDFTRVERFNVSAGAGGDDKSVFLWQNIGAPVAGGADLLPGFPSPESMMPGYGSTKSYEKQSSFPASFVKKLQVTIILDRLVNTPELDQKIRQIVPAILDMDANRDIVDVIAADFAPAWKTIWYQPEATGLLFKYGLISLMTLITLIVVAACFLKLAEAMDSMAQAQAHQLQMDFGQGKGGEKEEETKEEEEAAPAAGQPRIVFNVAEDQVENLWEILRRQDPENIALVAAHLKPEVKKAFLARMPTAVQGEVFMFLGRVRFVEPDVVATVKEELERRLESAVGGRRDLMDLIKDADLKAKKELLRIMEARDIDMARVIRGMIILFEDLVGLEPREWSVVLSAVPMELWASALYDAEDSMRSAAQSQMLPKTWAILTQMMDAAKPSEAASSSARERVVEAVDRLIKEGRISKPEPRRLEAIMVESEAAR